MTPPPPVSRMVRTKGITVLRTHNIGTLGTDLVGQTVTLTGWVDRRRDHGGVAFIDLRDASGIAQVVVRDERVAHELRSEFVLKVTGEVCARPEGNENPHLATGAIEVMGDDIEILNTSAPLPFQVSSNAEDSGNVGEETRLKYRYLDLRREPEQYAIRLRSKVSRAAREALYARDPDPDPFDPRRRPRLHRARAPLAGFVVRLAAVTSALQAAAHGGRHGTLLPDRSLLP